MKLDKRIKSKEDILTCFDIEKAGQFLGHKGYFANVNSSYQNLDNKAYGILTEIKDAAYSFKMDNNEYWRFFIPEIILKPKGKKYRPYTLQEFKGNLPKMIFPDDLIHFRHKNNENGSEECALKYNGYIIESNATFICLGSREYSLENLFKNGEYLGKDGEFKPFGVEE